MLDTAHPDVATALQIVRQGASMAQRVLASMAMQNLTKSDFSPVTVADFASQALAAHTLREAGSNLPLVGEKTRFGPPRGRGRGGAQAGGGVCGQGGSGHLERRRVQLD